MSIVAIPKWNAQGVLPPIDPAGAPTSPSARSPYRTSLVNVVLHFNTSPERLAILEGFLKFRAILHGLGLVKGFQWLDGSMLENVETLEGRAPHDVDVVTFYWLPAGKKQADIMAVGAASLSNPKGDYKVDAYLVELGAPAETLVERSRYWYSMWSHRRNGLWKGYIEVDLDPAEDVTAKQNLAINAGGVKP
jgi:hypothetical protein